MIGTSLLVVLHSQTCISTLTKYEYPYLILEWTSSGTQLLLAFCEVCKLENKITCMHMKDKINTIYGIK